MELEKTPQQSQTPSKSRPSNVVTVSVSFYSQSGDCFEAMSARLSQLIIGTASAVQAAETATWAVQWCVRVCVCMCGGDGDGDKTLGLHKDRVAVYKIPTGHPPKCYYRDSHTCVQTRT